MLGGVVLAVNRPHPVAQAAVHRGVPAVATSSQPDVLELGFVSANTGFTEVTHRLHTSADGLFRTDDGGRTWHLLWEGPRTLFQFVDPDHGFLFGDRNPGLLATVDGGNQWTLLQWPKPGMPAAAAFAPAGAGLAVFPGSSELVAGARPAVVYRTADAGRTWTPTATLYGPSDRAPATDYVAGLGLTAGGLAWLLFDSGLSRSLWVSRDGGSSWSRVQLPVSPDPGLVDPDLHLDGRSGSLVVTTQWVSGPVNVNGPGISFPEPTGPIPTYLYQLQPDGSGWRPLELPSQPFGEYAAALAGDGSGFLLGGRDDCRITATYTNACTFAGLGDVAVDRLDILDANAMVAFDHRFGLSFRSDDAGGHWRLLSPPRG